MKKAVFFLLVLMSASLMFGQQRVAVYVTGGGDADIEKILGDQLTSAIAKSGKYLVLERTSIFFTELSRELNYLSIDDSEQLSRFGKQFGVQLLCIVNISDLFGEQYIISARLIDMESAEVIVVATVKSKLEKMQELLNVTGSLAKKLSSETVKEKAAKAAAKEIAAKEST